MNTYSLQRVKIADIEAKLDNPRFNTADNQRDVIDKMIEDQQTLHGPNKLLNLAKDIVKNGMNPAERVIVAIHVADPNKFITLEGNRRLICLKLLETPEIIERSNPKLFKQFKSLSQEFAKAPIREVDCVVFENESDAKKWIELKHTGENNGIGVVGWDAQQSSRFAGNTNLALQAIDFLRNSTEVEEGLKTKLAGVPSSSLNRLLDDPSFRENIGFQKINDKLSTELDPGEARKILVKVVSDLLDPNFKVKEIYTKENRKEYFEKISASELPDITRKVETWSVEAPPDENTSTSSGASGSTTVPKKTKLIPPSSDRKVLIPKAFKIKIAETKPNTIYHELRKLSVEEFPNSAGVMFRVFLELSVDAYMDKHSISFRSNDGLKDKVKKLANHFEANGTMTHDELFGIRSLAADSDGLFSVTSFNKYVHNYHFQPITKDLKTAWDNIQLYLQKIWETY